MSNRPCKICNTQVNRKKPGIQCSSFCEEFYHGQCLGLTMTQLDTLRVDGASWSCADCRQNSPARVDRRASMGQQIQQSQLAGPTNSLGSRSSTYLGDVSVLEELRKIREEMVMLRESVSFCSNKITDFQGELAKMSDRIKVVDKLVAENNQLKSKLQSAENKINDLDQSARSKNLEIHGIPERENENLLEIFKKVGQTLKVVVDDNMVEFIHRVPTNGKYSPREKPKNIIVGLLSRKHRDSILSAVKSVRTQSEGNHLAVEGLSNKVYINEHLTIINKILHKETRDVARQKKYKYVWVKNGNIFVRKTDVSQILHIKSLDMLSKLQ